jgi:hypothetical protein
MYHNAAVLAAIVLAYSVVAGRVGRFSLSGLILFAVASLVLGPAVLGMLHLAMVPLAALGGTAAEPLGSSFIACRPPAVRLPVAGLQRTRPSSLWTSGGRRSRVCTATLKRRSPPV